LGIDSELWSTPGFLNTRLKSTVPGFVDLLRGNLPIFDYLRSVVSYWYRLNIIL